MNGWMPRHMAPGSQPLYMLLSLKIRGIIKLLSHCVWLERVCVFAFVCACLVCTWMCVLFWVRVGGADCDRD